MKRKRRDWRYDYEASTRETWTAIGKVRHLTVKRLSGQDGIGWDVLQRIKNDLLGVDATAVEVFPPQSDVVNEANIRHLWEVDGIFKHGWPLNMRCMADWR
jgi:hypothetical protein